jgi:hypothetical protein
VTYLFPTAKKETAEKSKETKERTHQKEIKRNKKFII